MTVTLDLKPEVQTQLSAQAQARDMNLHAYIVSLLEEAAGSRIPQPKRRLTHEEIRALLDSLAQFSDQIPPAPEETFSRAMIYQDHD
jgi:hypothetical protein